MTVESARIRILIPATRQPAKERLLLVKPWFLRRAVPGRGEDLPEGQRVAPAFERAGDGNEPNAPPQILTFTSEEFVAAFFAGVEAANDGFTAGAFERLIDFRDWSEPPAAMVDVRGEPLYPSAVKRHAPPLALADSGDPSRRCRYGNALLRNRAGADLLFFRIDLPPLPGGGSTGGRGGPGG